MRSYPHVAIVIVSWNGRGLLKTCLLSLKALTYPAKKITIIVVDNGSNDNTRTWIAQNYPHISVIRNRKNVGFAKGNNIGIAYAFKNSACKYTVTLNNDTSVEKNWLTELIQHMEQNSSIGSAVGKIVQFHNRQLLDSAGDYFAQGSFRVVNHGFNKRDSKKYSMECEILSACAAASIFRNEALTSIKMDGEFFDEQFVSYIEDVDLNIRLRLNGWTVNYVPSAIVYHIGSATSSKISREYKEFFSRRNRLFFAIKNFPPRQLFFLLIKYVLPSGQGITYYLHHQVQRTIKKGSAHYRRKGILFYIRLVFERLIKGRDRLSLLEVFLIQTKAVFAVFFALPTLLKKRKAVQKMKIISNSNIARWFDIFVVDISP